MKLSWKKFRRNIPTSIKLLKASYEVLWQEDLVSGQNEGETRFDPKQIVLHNNTSQKEAVHTFMHEYFHALSNEYDVGLTESQVVKLEKALPDLLKVILKLLGK